MRLLMCPPRYYGIQYEINPWMSRSRQSDPELAGEQWQRLYLLLSDRLGIAIDLIEPRPRLPDMVFTANAGLVWRDKFISSQFRHDVRRGETPHFEEWFSEKQYQVLHPPAGFFFEGEGDLLLCGNLLFAGYHIRSDVVAHQKIAEILEREILSLELTNAWFYHLDTCFCPLAEGAALYYPDAFDSYALKVLSSHIANLIAVPDEEARRFACNAVVGDKKVVMNEGCPKTRARLEELGFSVFATPLGEFIKAGGSAKCLVLKVPHAEGTF
jgi:N-dimethylarginine dimethylaminohydrolase